MSLKIVYFGTPQFSADILSQLLDAGIEVAAVVSQPDRPKGRSLKLLPTPVKEVALQHGIPLHQPPKASSKTFAEELAAYKADLFIVVAYGEILKDAILAIPSVDCINLHTSLLPKYRGAAPMQAAILAGERETGVSLIRMVRKMDAGPILAQSRVSLPLSMNLAGLEGALLKEGGRLLIDCIREVASKGRIEGCVQDEEAVSFAPKIQAEDLHLDWNESAESVHNRVRAFSPKPGAWTWVDVKGQKKRLRILETRVVEGVGTPGDIMDWNKDSIVIACGERAISVLELQLEGKKSMQTRDFTCGFGRAELKVQVDA